MSTVEAHYAKPGLLQRLQDALRQSGLDPDHLKQDDLSKLDQFHVGGLDATNALAQLAQIQKSDRVLDLGSGIGGPSRHLAAALGCRVTGLDLTREYCDVATWLAHATGLDSLVSYRHGDALAAPFAAHSFDVVWTQHASMNIENKPALHREMFRVLNQGGRVALHDVVAGEGTMRFPVPWARTSELSFLISPDELRASLEAAGFRDIALHDTTAEGLEFLRRMAARGPVSGFGLGTLMGPEFPSMIATLIANLESGACRLTQGIGLVPRG